MQAIVNALGLDRASLVGLMSGHVTESNINAFGRLDALKKTVDPVKARDFFSKREGKPLPPPIVSMRIDKLLREFILTGGFDLD
ncbi:MAG: hypothetical protein QM302_00135 [Acidobacteriota bacterium]|nr:hypothetical protein [Acidobacteriota bacterium]